MLVVNDTLDDAIVDLNKSSFSHPLDNLRHGRKATQVHLVCALEIIVDVPAVTLAVWVHADDGERSAATEQPSGLMNEGFLLREMMKGIHAVDEIEMAGR